MTTLIEPYGTALAEDLRIAQYYQKLDFQSTMTPRLVLGFTQPY